MRINLKLVLSLISFFPLLIVAQKPASVLWEITGKQLSKKSYLLGTIHTVSYELLDTFPEIKTIISSCDYGLFEKGDRSVGKMKDTVIYTPPLDSVFSATEYALVDSFFSNSPFGSIAAHNNDADLGAMLQVVMMTKESSGQKHEMFFDEYIQLYMDSLHKETFMLDERTQMAKQAVKENWRLLAKAIVYFIRNNISSENLDLNKYYNKKLYRSSLTNAMKLHEQPKDSVIIEGSVERNSIWLPKIVTMMKKGSCFIAVGLGHIQYTTGIIQLLRKEGYIVKPLTLKRKGQTS
jgi:uncharacterized protein